MHLLSQDLSGVVHARAQRPVCIAKTRSGVWGCIKDSCRRKVMVAAISFLKTRRQARRLLANTPTQQLSVGCGNLEHLP